MTITTFVKPSASEEKATHDMSLSSSTTTVNGAKKRKADLEGAEHDVDVQHGKDIDEETDNNVSIGNLQEKHISLVNGAVFTSKACVTGVLSNLSEQGVLADSIEPPQQQILPVVTDSMRPTSNYLSSSTKAATTVTGDAETTDAKISTSTTSNQTNSKKKLVSKSSFCSTGSNCNKKIRSNEINSSVVAVVAPKAVMTKDDRKKFHSDLGYKPLTLHDIYHQIKDLCFRFPKVPSNGFILTPVAVTEHDDDNHKSNINRHPKQVTSEVGDSGLQDHPQDVNCTMESLKCDDNVCLSQPISSVERKNFIDCTSPSVQLHEHPEGHRPFYLNHTNKLVITQTARQELEFQQQQRMTAIGIFSSEDAAASSLRSICYDKTAILNWATTVQSLLEEFRLILASVGAATYAWSAERSGAAEQNLSTLSAELMHTKEQINARVIPHLNDIVSPVVNILTDRVVTYRSFVPNSQSAAVTSAPFTTTQHFKREGRVQNFSNASLQTENTSVDTTKIPSLHHVDKLNSTRSKLTTTTSSNADMVETEVKENYFVTTYQDPDYVHFCYVVVASNAEKLRHVILSNIDKSLRAMEDYIAAQVKDNQHDSRGFVY